MDLNGIPTNLKNLQKLLMINFHISKIPKYETQAYFKLWLLQHFLIKAHILQYPEYLQTIIPSSKSSQFGS
ncbi:hypothetical protein EUTSA_v10015206mg [Eutrema salsugineum]|uniref:Uncharacterized protein n=1 Tax=Eutrema salsugineum TaxID=72664 RepID=V4LJY3_EUTSA|nr:hypothetical protein EUTSA_v10015206mg [Eutrema salsugineum]